MVSCGPSVIEDELVLIGCSYRGLRITDRGTRAARLRFCDCFGACVWCWWCGFIRRCGARYSGRPDLRTWMHEDYLMSWTAGRTGWVGAWSAWTWQ